MGCSRTRNSGRADGSTTAGAGGERQALQIDVSMKLFKAFADAYGFGAAHRLGIPLRATAV